MAEADGASAAEVAAAAQAVAAEPAARVVAASVRTAAGVIEFGMICVSSLRARTHGGAGRFFASLSYTKSQNQTPRSPVIVHVVCRL